MNTRTNTRIRTIGAVLGASALVAAVGATIAVADSPAPETPAVASVDLAGIAAWADANGLVGLSPAGLTPAPTAEPAIASIDLEALAAWANANGHTGLSPASLRPIDG